MTELFLFYVSEYKTLLEENRKFRAAIQKVKETGGSDDDLAAEQAVEELLKLV